MRLKNEAAAYAIGKEAMALHERGRRGSLAAVVITTLLVASPATADPLSAGFNDPPSAARPRVWWHWMNGNVTKDGIAKDLEWMKRVGIGGLQNFDANLATPQIVPQRLAYMTPKWKDAFRFAVERAETLGLEFAIASSPGWSETGGPWVKPQDGMKKLVWSEIELVGGRRAVIKLPAPPTTSGPYQDLAIEADELGVLTGDKQFEPPTHYEDIAVLGFPSAQGQKLSTPRISSNNRALDAQALIDDKLTTIAEVPRGSAERPTVITIDYDGTQTVRSASIFVTNGFAARYDKLGLLPRIEARIDAERWRKVADVPITTVPSTVSFAPITARSFRVVLEANPEPYQLNPAPGADLALLASLFKPQPMLQIAQLNLFGEAKVNQFETKAGFSVSDNYYSLDTNVALNLDGIAPGDVIDLTARMKSDGTLEWTPPQGRWRIVRLGYSLTGKSNHPATFEATGLEVDKYDGSAVRDYMETHIGMYKDAVGSQLVGERGVRAVLTDSIEVGASNWTPKFLEHFQRLRGYDPTPYLPTLTGAIVGSRRDSDLFLYDFRRTLSDLITSEHYGVIAQVAHEQGLKVYGEALEGHRRSLGDDLDMRRYVDFPMAAFWTYNRNTGPSSTYCADMKGASSTANLYGQNIVAAESMTSAFAPWGDAPADLRRVIDLGFAHGINRAFIHTSVHQPIDDKQPGLSLMFYGQFFTRHETWAEMAKPWIDYIARNSFLLQQGRNVADVAYFYGEEAPLSGRSFDAVAATLPKRYAYDFVNADALLNVLGVHGTELVAPSGARYRVLYLGGMSERMTLSVLRRLASLAEAGATIVGRAPQGSPSLNDDAGEFSTLVKRMWSGRARTTIGRGLVIASTDVEAALASLGLPPDFSYDKRSSDSEVLFVHRRLDDSDIYFVSNRRNEAETTEARFRVTGKQPEIWRADTGAIEPLSYRIENGQTTVPLDMNPEDSFFVVFRKPTTRSSETVAKPSYTPVMTIEGDWNVSFQTGRGAPAGVRLASLASLSEHPDLGIKYFSGVATYSKRFTLPKRVNAGQPLMLDLGSIGDVVEVRVNEQLVGTLWHAPYRVDLGNAIRTGNNELEIKVANLWVNRLIGDAQPNATKVTFTTIATYRADAPLRPSGLIGPIRILAQLNQEDAAFINHSSLSPPPDSN